MLQKLHGINGLSNCMWLGDINAQKDAEPVGRHHTNYAATDSLSALCTPSHVFQLLVDPHRPIHDGVWIIAPGIQHFQVSAAVLCPRPVPRMASKDVPRVPGRDGRDDEEGKDGPVAHAVHGRVTAGEEERCRDATAVGNRDHASRGEGRGRRAADHGRSVL